MTLITVAQQLRTQWLAQTLGYQVALGKPLFVAHGVPVYGFWRSFGWVDHLASMPAAADLVRNASLWSFVSTVLSLAVAMHVVVRGLRSDRNRTGEIHGSARWANREEIERTGLLATRGIVAGKWIDKKTRRVRYLRHNGPEHALVFAPTGSGKGVGLVLPTLLTWTESCLVLDPKGENHAKTSGWRTSIGQRVYKLDFAAPPSGTAAFNPLSAVRLRSAQETADVQRIGRLIVDPDGKQFEGANKHWAETAASLLTGTILHVLYREDAKGRRATLADVVDELSDRNRNHSQVLLDWLAFPHDPKLTQGWQDSGAPSATHPVVAASAREQLNREDKERSAVLSSAVTPLALFRDPLLAANTARSDFTIEELMDAEQPVTLYFVLRPDDIHRLRPIVRILLDLMLRRLVQTMSFAGGEEVAPHKHKLLLLLDEFPILGKLDIFSEALAYMRGWGIRAELICQDYEQLRATYGDRETISSNCQLQLAYAPNKVETAKHLSLMTGTTTVVKRARSASQSIGRFAASRNNESEQEVSRPLLTPDECMRLPGPLKRGTQIVKPGDMLVFFAGTSPIYAQQPLYFKDPTLLTRSRMPPSPPRAAPGAPIARPSLEAAQAETHPIAAAVAGVPSAVPALASADLASSEDGTTAQAPAAVHDLNAPRPTTRHETIYVPHAALPQAHPFTVHTSACVVGEREVGPVQTASAPTGSPGAAIATPDAARAADRMAQACAQQVTCVSHDTSELGSAISRLNAALRGHKVKLAQDVDPSTADVGPRFVRAYAMLEPGESISSVRRCSEDLARAIGTLSADIHVANVPAKHAVGLDLPIPSLSYLVTFDELTRHPSFTASAECLRLGFCAGIDVSGRPIWADLADMPHLLVAGTTGSGKTIFLRTVVLTLLMARTAAQVRVRLSTSKPGDFRLFEDSPHTQDGPLAATAADAKRLALELVAEMDARYESFAHARADAIDDFNAAQPQRALHRIVAVFDEYAEMRASFQDPTERLVFDTAISRLAQKARAAGIHLILCMQRPDAKALDGSIKANVLHRVALKLPQGSDSRVILDAGGAETLLGQGDLFYKDAAGAVTRLQVPALDTTRAQELLRDLAPVTAAATPIQQPASQSQRGPAHLSELDDELVALGAGHDEDPSDWSKARTGDDDEDPFADEVVLGDEVPE